MTRLTLFCQPSIPDSLKRIPVAQWQLQRLINDAQTLRVLEVYTGKLEEQAVIMTQLVVAQDSSLQLKDQIIEKKNQIIGETSAQVADQKLLTKDERRKKRRWRLVAIVGIPVMGYLAIKD